MSTTIYRGSTPTIRFTVNNGMKVSELGDPTIAISQTIAFITYSGEDVVVDTAANSVSVKLTEDDTLSLTAGVATQAQVIFAQDADNIVRFPIHTLDVAETLVDALFEDDEEDTGE